MNKLLIVLVCFVATTLNAAPCERTHEGATELHSPHTIQYASHKLEPGETVELGGKTYVMKRIPFVEFLTGKHYALTVPVLVTEGSSRLDTHFNLKLRHQPGNDCSDVATVGGGQPVHKISVDEIRTTSHRTTDDLSGNSDQTTFSVSRMVTANLYIQIGATNLSILMGIDKVEIPLTGINSIDQDMTDDITWAFLAHWPYSQIYLLNQLIDYIYISSL
ncbi:MAG: hypothetical protein IMF09_05120 [Proteobacteria bacterium]|nr:hypothetical protein [Pseudomonadota bacterium]